MRLATAPLPPLEIAGELSTFTGVRDGATKDPDSPLRHPGRGAGTDAERRAAMWLADQLRADGREVLIEPFWCRPNTPLTHALHALLGMAGSIIAVHNQRLGGALLLIAAVSVLCDSLFGISLGRRFTPERASQNVVALPPKGARRRRVTLVLTANYDSGRMGLLDRDALRRPPAIARAALRGWTFGYVGWLMVALLVLIGVAIARYEGAADGLVSFLQLVPTLGLVVAVASLLERAGSPYSPGAGDNASGVAAVIALARAFDAEPLYEAAVHVVLTGGGDNGAIGLRTYLRGRRKSLRASNTVVFGVGPAAAAVPRYWHSDGPFIPLRYFKELRRLAQESADQDPALGVERYRGRGMSPALAGRLTGIPSIAIASLDEIGLAPRSGQPEDVVAALDPAVIDRQIRYGLLLADSIDCFLEDFAPKVAAQAQRPGLWERIGGLADWLGRPTLRRRARPR